MYLIFSFSFLFPQNTVILFTVNTLFNAVDLFRLWLLPTYILCEQHHPDLTYMVAGSLQISYLISVNKVLELKVLDYLISHVVSTAKIYREETKLSSRNDDDADISRR